MAAPAAVAVNKHFKITHNNIKVNIEVLIVI
jgi:hypothetical protein